MRDAVIFLIVLAGLGLILAAAAHAQGVTGVNSMSPSLPIGGVSIGTSGGPAVFAGKGMMNGYSLSQFPDFIKKFHFVTVRYRKDTGEMRFTYANDAAWKTLLAGGAKYPDGAVFAKIGIATEEDPGFTSSAVPSGAKRYQLMVMDRKKNAATDGWGYALFDVNGKTFEQNPAEQTPACHACHKLVPERDYVFSQPMQLAVGLAAAQAGAPSFVPPSRVIFVTKPARALPSKVKEALPPGFKEVRAIEGEMTAHMFQGTVDEIRPTLTQETLRSKLPALLISDSGAQFSMVAIKKDTPCDLPDGNKGVEMIGTYTIKPGPEEKYPVSTMSYCELLPVP
jgi:cytochrome P460